MCFTVKWSEDDEGQHIHDGESFDRDFRHLVRCGVYMADAVCKYSAWRDKVPLSSLSEVYFLYKDSYEYATYFNITWSEPSGDIELDIDDITQMIDNQLKHLNVIDLI